MCGIFGQSTSNPKKLNQANIRILGMFNESRGKNSCGITYDDEIYHGLNTQKLFTDFMKGRDFKAEHNPLMFGHTRSASSGVVNEYNAHPFGFGINKKTGGYKFIGVHNGTLYNQTELAQKYGINPTAVYTNEYKVELTRTKIDSEVLLEIIHRTRSFDVLTEYIGRAALVWTDTERPNVTYLWSGQSRAYENFQTGMLIEERPMNVWVEDKESFYFSSMPESLQAIGAKAVDVKQIDYNTVHIITNGDFENARKIPVSRLESWHTETYVAQSYKGAYSSHNDCDWTTGQGKLYGENNVEYVDLRKNRLTDTAVTASTAAKSTSPINIYDDKSTHDQNAYGNKVYSKQLRYWKKGHLVTGVHLYIRDYGFHILGAGLKEAHTAWEKLKGVRFVDGAFDYDGLKTGGIYPVQAIGATASFHYIVDGVLLKTQLDYIQVLDTPMLRNDYVKMSHMSTHPIIDMKYTFKLESKQEILKNGIVYNGTVNGLSFEKVYEVSKGNLVKMTPKEINGFPKVVKLPVITEVVAEHLAARDANVLHNEAVLVNAYTNIVKLEDSLVEEVDDAVEEEGEIIDNPFEEDTDPDQIVEIKITELMDNEITPCVMSFQNVRDELELMPQTNLQVIETKKLMEDAILLITNYIK